MAAAVEAVGMVAVDPLLLLLLLELTAPGFARPGSCCWVGGGCTLLATADLTSPVFTTPPPLVMGVRGTGTSCLARTWEGPAGRVESATTTEGVGEVATGAGPSWEERERGRS